MRHNDGVEVARAGRWDETEGMKGGRGEERRQRGGGGVAME